jgi:Domain of unknown function (DUF4376)
MTFKPIEDEIIAMMAKIEDDHVVGIYPKIKDVPFPDDAPDMHWVDVTDLPEVAVGWVMKEDGSFTEPPPPSLDERRESLLDAVRVERRRRLDAGIEFNGNRYATDLRGQSNINFAAAQLLFNPEAPIFLSTIEGVVSEFDDAAFRELMKVLIEYRESIQRAAEEHKRDIEASDQPENYDFRSGWPPSLLDDEDEYEAK